MTIDYTDNSLDRVIYDRKLAYVLEQNDKLVSRINMQTKKQRLEEDINRRLRKAIITTGYAEIANLVDREQAISIALTSAIGMAQFELRKYITLGNSFLRKDITTMIDRNMAYAMIDAYWY